MKEINEPNMVVTFFQVIAIIIALLLFNVGISGICLIAMGTAGLIALIMTIGTWGDHSLVRTRAATGCMALNAAVLALALWGWNQNNHLTLLGFALVGRLTDLLIRKIQYGSKQYNIALLATALPNIGLLFAAAIGIRNHLKEAKNS